jgi:hypothetical protein
MGGSGDNDHALYSYKLRVVTSKGDDDRPLKPGPTPS